MNKITISEVKTIIEYHLAHINDFPKAMINIVLEYFMDFFVREVSKGVECGMIVKTLNGKVWARQFLELKEGFVPLVYRYGRGTYISNGNTVEKLDAATLKYKELCKINGFRPELMWVKETRKGPLIYTEWDPSPQYLTEECKAGMSSYWINTILSKEDFESEVRTLIEISYEIYSRHGNKTAIVKLNDNVFSHSPRKEPFGVFFDSDTKSYIAMEDEKTVIYTFKESTSPTNPNEILHLGNRNFFDRSKDSTIKRTGNSVPVYYFSFFATYIDKNWKMVKRPRFSPSNARAKRKIIDG